MRVKNKTKAIVLISILVTAFFVGTSIEKNSTEKNSKIEVIDKLLSEEAKKTNKPIIIPVELKYEFQYGKVVKGGQLIKGDGTVPFDTKREDIRGLILANMKYVMERHPKCEWIWIGFNPDRMPPGVGRYIAIGEYREGGLTIRYGIPTEKQMQESNESLKLFRPSIAYYDKALELFLQSLKMQELYLDASDKQLFELVASKTNTSFKETKEKISFMYSYYTGVAYGSETIDLNNNNSEFRNFD